MSSFVFIDLDVNCLYLIHFIDSYIYPILPQGLGSTYARRTALRPPFRLGLQWCILVPASGSASAAEAERLLPQALKRKVQCRAEKCTPEGVLHPSEGVLHWAEGVLHPSQGAVLPARDLDHSDSTRHFRHIN